jgi:hypothetical protein
MKKLSILLILPMLLFTTSCEKFIEDYDVSPNSPSEVTPGLLLTMTQVAVFAQYTGQLSRNAAVYAQQINGTDFQMLDVANYVLFEGDNINEWTSIYTDILMESQALIDMSGENPWYRGMGQVIKAMGLGLATDCWGDIPNREALGGLGGAANFNPNYDAQEVVYEDIIALLDAAIVNFGKGLADNKMIPGGEDLIYGGDVTLWMKAAYTLKARYTMHLSARGASMQDVLDALANGISDNSEDMLAVFGTSGNELNTWYAFENARPGYMHMHATFVDFLASISDPRLPFYAATDDNGGYSGTPLGSADQTTSPVGPYLATTGQPVPLATYEEALFLKAEAYMRLSNGASAATAHNDAIKASVLKVTGASDPAFEAAQASETAASISLNKIMTHKWVACFGMFEVWTDWRRTGIPTLVPNPNGEVAGIPLRFPTPLDERVSNSNALVISDILLPVWWDNN